MTWAALAADSRYGDAGLQRRVDFVKANLFGRPMETAEEETLDPTVIEYAGKLVAISVIPAGAEYWAAQKIQDNSGERVSAQWTDRSEKLWKLHKQLISETRVMLPDVQAILGTNVRVTRARPRIGVSDNTSDKFVTGDPFGFERTYIAPESTILEGAV